MSNLKPTALVDDISLLIEQSRQQLAVQANSTLTLLFWKIGRRINEDILQNKRADYGKQIVAPVATQLEKLEKKLHQLLMEARERVQHKRITSQNNGQQE